MIQSAVIFQSTSSLAEGVSQSFYEEPISFTRNGYHELPNMQSLSSFALFPDTLSIDATKITISKKQFLATEQITIIPFRDISEAKVQTTRFFASITITYIPKAVVPYINQQVDIKISHLPIEDALRIKTILTEVLNTKFGESNGVI